MRVMGKEVVHHGVNSMGPMVNCTKTSAEIRMAKWSCDQLGWASSDKILFGFSEDNHSAYLCRSEASNAVQLRPDKGGFVLRSRVIYDSIRAALGVSSDSQSFCALLKETPKMHGPYVWYELVLKHVKS